MDGVHSTPHVPTDLAALGADFYACSSYKFCGPHTGAVVADPALLEELRPAKLVPATDKVPGRFEQGTPPFELLAGVRATVDWLAGLTDAPGDRRARLLAAFSRDRDATPGPPWPAGQRPLRHRRRAPAGSAAPAHFDGVLRRRRALPVGSRRPLGRRGIAVWDGDNYAYELMDRFGLAETGGAIRAAIVLYTTAEEIDRLVAAVAAVAGR